MTESVIAEIDALISSYNWETLVDDPDDVVSRLKMVMRTQSPHLAPYFNHLHPRTQFFVFCILMHMLQHPGIQRKECIFASLGTLSDIIQKERDESVGLRAEKQRILRDMRTVLQRYTRHGNATYRLYAVRILSQLTPHIDQVVHDYLGILRKERSFTSILWICISLVSSLRHRTYRFPLTDANGAEPLRYLAVMRQSPRPLMRLAANAVSLQLLMEKTPQETLDEIAADWPALDDRKQVHDWIISSLINGFHYLDDSTLLNITIALLLNSASSGVLQSVWALARTHVFPDSDFTRRIAFTRVEKAIIEALLRRKPLTRTGHIMDPKWSPQLQEDRSFLETNGLEPTWSALRRQLDHAQTLDLPAAELRFYGLNFGDWSLPLTFKEEWTEASRPFWDDDWVAPFPDEDDEDEHDDGDGLED